MLPSIEIIISENISNCWKSFSAVVGQEALQEATSLQDSALNPQGDLGLYETKKAHALGLMFSFTNTKSIYWHLKF